MSNEIADATTNGDSPKKNAEASNTSDTPLKPTTGESNEQQASLANNTADNLKSPEITKETQNDDDTSKVPEEAKPIVQNGDVKKNTATPEPASESAGIQLKAEKDKESTADKLNSVVTPTLPAQTIPPVKTDTEGDIQMTDAPKDTKETNTVDANTHSNNGDQSTLTTTTTALPPPASESTTAPTTTTSTSISDNATTTATSIEIPEPKKQPSPVQTTQPTQQSPQVPKTEVETASIKPEVSSTDEVMLDNKTTGYHH
ncbi:unnamed protein product [Ambrosiozyma monospora]|uniref:Unnamed protein product n=1 Tax=Ambrosiozyma monospora TaxID=43982 RepID=A0ACB5TND7_AMBMO|nr:unnamed protein product [Ambrosiozyma monospora]